MFRRLLFTIPALALLPVAAHAATVSHTKFATPSKQLRCHAIKVQGPGIECKGSFLPDFQRKLALDPYVALKPRGRTSYGERSDYTGYNVKTRTLRYGDTWQRAGITCKLTRSSFTCRNRDRHGFTLTKGNVKRF